MIRIKHLLLLGGAACLLHGAAQAAEADLPPQWQETQNQVRALGERVAKIEALLQNHAALNLLKEVEAMKGELSRLRGKDETQDHQLESLGKRQSDLYVDLDKRVDDLGKQIKTAVQPTPAVTPVVVQAPPVKAAPEQVVASQTRSEPSKSAAAKAAEPADDPVAESKAYETALNLFRSGNYAGAVNDFKAFLKAHPDSSLAPNAQYWTGYAYYALKDYKNALEQQKKLVSTWPQSQKVPDALLNIASNQVELDDLASAKKNLEEIIAKYPGTNAAAIATKRLALLK